MSRTFNSRPTVSQIRGRESKFIGTQSTSTNRSQSILRGERIPPPSEALPTATRGSSNPRGNIGVARPRGKSSRGMWDPNGGRGIYDPYGRSLGGGPGGHAGYGGRGAYRRGRDERGFGVEDEELDDMSQAVRNPQDPNQRSVAQERMTYTGAYTVISPDQKKRQQILSQADRETRQYEEYKQQNKPQRFSYVGTVGESQAVSMMDARQQQIQTHATSKTNKLLKEQERKLQQKQQQEAEVEQKRAAARRQAELNEQKKEREQQQKAAQWQNDMKRKNQAFLDRLEAENKGKTVTATAISSTGAGGGGDTAGNNRHGGGRGGGVKPHVSLSAFASPTNSKLSTSSSPSSGFSNKTSSFQRSFNMGEGDPATRYSYHNSSRGGFGGRDSVTGGSSGYGAIYSDDDDFSVNYSSCGGSGGGGEDRQMKSYSDQLEILQGMFPHYESSALLNILEQCEGSLEDAVDLIDT